MRRPLTIIAGIVAVLLVAVAVAVLTLTDTNWGREKVRGIAVNALAGSAHGIVKVGRISGNMLKGLTLHDLSITDSSSAPFVSLDSLHAGYGLRMLISRKIELRDVGLYGAHIVLDRQPGGVWNYERIFPRDSTAAPGQATGRQFGDWLVFHDVVVRRGHITIRTPWPVDSALSPAQRDSAVAFALSDKSRARVRRVANGFQQVREFQRIDARMPLVRIAHPDFTTRRLEVDSLSLLALVFAPPAADIRRLSGTVEMNSDSLWFRQADVALPASRLRMDGRYALKSGDVSLRANAHPIALSDIRFAFLALPDSGIASFDLALDMTGRAERYMVQKLDLRTGTAVATGSIGIALGDTLYLHQTDVIFHGVDTRLIEQLVPGLDVPRQGLIAGRVKVDGSLAAMQVNGDVTFTDVRSGRSRVIAAGEIGSADGILRARNLRVALSPVQVDLARIGAPDFPLGGTVTGSATLNGATNTRLSATRVDLTLLDRGARSRFAGTGGMRLGKVPFFDIDLQARPLSLVTVGRFAPAAGLRGDVTGPVRLSGTLADLAISSTLRSLDGGVISVTGRLDVASKEVGYTFELATELFNANALVAKAPRTSLNAQLSARGRGLDPATLQAVLAAHVSTSTIDTLALDSSTIRVRIVSGIANVDTFVVRAPGAAVGVTGTFGLSKTSTGSLAYRVDIDSLGKLARYLPFDTSTVYPRPARTAERLARLRADSARTAQRLAVARAAGAAPPAVPVVADTPPAIGRDSLAGAIHALGTLSGGLSGFSTKGTATATGLVVLGHTVRRARTSFEANGVLTPDMAASVIANADSVSAGGFALDSVETRATYKKPGGTAQISIYQNSERDYSLGADYAIYTDRREVRFNTLRLRFDTTRWASTRPGMARWGQPGIELDSIELRNGSNGRVFVDGRLPANGAVNLKLVIANFEVGDLMGLLQSDVQARGLLSVNTTLSGTMAAPVIRGDAGVANAMLRGTVVPDVRTSFDYADVKLTARADATYVERSLATVSGVIPINLALQGVTTSRITDAPAAIDMRADSVPLELAARFTGAVSQIQGFARGTATLRGSLRKPLIEGDVGLSLGQARVNALGVTMRQITGHIRMHGDTVVVDSLAAQSPGGRIVISGGVGIAKIADPAFDLRLNAFGARVLDNEMGRIRADASIAMVGPMSSVDIRGRARVREGVIYIPKTDDKQVIDAGDRAVFAVIDTSNVTTRALVPGQSPFLANLRMNLRLGVDRDTWVRSTEANVEIYTDGDLRIDVDRRRQAITLDGVVNTDRGEYVFLSRRFQIKRGTATFVGTQEIDPLLQLTGEYLVKRASQQSLAMRVLIGGTLLAPRLTLESDAQPPIPQSDLLSYLAFGSESGSLLQFGGSSVSGGTPGGGLVGATAAMATQQLAGVGLGILVKEFEGKAARALGADQFNITPSNIPPEFASGNFGGFNAFLKGTQFEFGKYFTTATFVGMQAQLSSTPGFRVEHRFRGHRGLSIESTLQPRFFLPEPSLSAQTLIGSNALGIFLVRRWRF